MQDPGVEQKFYRTAKRGTLVVAFQTFSALVVEVTAAAVAGTLAAA